MASITIRQLDDDLKQPPAAAGGEEWPLDGGGGAHHPGRRGRRSKPRLVLPGIKRLRRTATTQRTTRQGAFSRRARNALS